MTLLDVLLGPQQMGSVKGRKWRWRGSLGHCKGFKGFANVFGFNLYTVQEGVDSRLCFTPFELGNLREVT